MLVKEVTKSLSLDRIEDRIVEKNRCGIYTCRRP